MTWGIGQELQGGKYVIEQILGQGGFGITYKALQVNLNRPVVIKTPNEYLNHDPEYDKYIEKFIAEGQILARLSQEPHPHIVGVFELFQEGNTHCLVMEFVPGENLFQAVKRRGALPEAEIVTYIRQIGEALMVVHQAGLVHRDAHPGNIMLRSNGKAVLIDFGIAKQIIPATQSSTDKAANERFAPYEQRYKGSRDPRVDIYCLAASLYYGVTGQYPTSSLARKLGNEPLIPPQKLISSISNELNQAILESMALEEEDRPPFMQSWLEIFSYKSSIPNVEEEVSNAEKENVNTAIKIVRAWKTINNVEENNTNVEPDILNVEEENPTVIPPPSVRDSYKKEVVDLKPTVEKKTIRKRRKSPILWVSLTILLLLYSLMSYILTAVKAPFLLWAVAVVEAVAVAVAVAVPWSAAPPAVTLVMAGVGFMAGPAAVMLGVIAEVGFMATVAPMAFIFALWAEEELRKSFSKFHTFLILAGTSNVALGLGWIVHRLFKLVG